MAAPAHYLADEARRLAIAEAREMITPLIERITALEKLVADHGIKSEDA